MVGSVTRWEPGVGGDQQHLAVTDHVAGLDPPIIPLSLPTLPRPLPSHAHTPRPAEDLDESVEETPCLEEHRRGRERTTSPRHAPSQPPASARPESLPGLDAPANGRQHNHHRAPAPTTSSAHEAHPGSAAHTSTNGTRRRPPPVLPSALATPDAWAEPEETAPLTPATNGEVARRGLNGVVVKKMAPVEEAVMEEEVEEGEEAALRDEEEVEEEELKCGLGPCCTPVWLQKYASKQMFLFVFCLTSVLQGMYYTYVVSILTTIEKLFQLQSKTTGIILSATEMGQIGGALLLTYYGGQGHRPKWIGWGIILFAFFAFFSSLPHFLFGDIILKRFQDSTPSQDNPLESANTCEVPGWSAPELNASLAAAGNATNDSCDSPDSLSQAVMSILFLSLLGVGIGQTAAYNLGIPYIDDNIASRESPIYFGLMAPDSDQGQCQGRVIVTSADELSASKCHTSGGKKGYIQTNKMPVDVIE
ncbi:solute carrier organic anion transporter family member 74D-like [Penaeus indicus]|uniref:solute carrier organic anion transporter family member 74D-like n=1 Tax=Penaeus indicus TaxID=29960 RepID=UPI00300CF5AA